VPPGEVSLAGVAAQQGAMVFSVRVAVWALLNWAL
jgi:hypothetical protein